MLFILAFIAVSFAPLTRVGAVANPPTIISPAIFSLENDTPKVDGPTGALTQQINIVIPPGRSGLQPNLALQYNSQNTAQDSELGYGWSLSIPYIERLNKTGSQNLYGPDPYFTSSIDGELATPAASTTYTPGITFDNSGLRNSTVNTNTVSFPYTVYNNANGVLIVAVELSGYYAADQVTSCSYGGVPMTHLLYNAGNSTYTTSNDLWYLYSPPVGIYTLTCNASSASMRQIFAASYTGVSQSVIPDSSNMSADTGSVSTVSLSTSVVQANSWLLMVGTGGSSSITSTSSAIRQNTNSELTLGDSNGPVGSGTQSLSWSVSPTTHWVATIISLAPATTSAPYRARVDDGGTFHSYSYSPGTNTWTMYDKNGTEYLFGASAQSRQTATTSPQQTYKWMLEKIVDPNNNYVRYVYNKDSNQIYPYQILYTGYNSTDGPMTVTFATTTRTDDPINVLPGFEVDTNYLISQITVSISGKNVRQYSLSYTTGNNGARSLLSSVQETGWNSSGTQTTLPPWTFGYVSSTTSFVLPYGGGSCGGDAYVATDATGHGVNDAALSYINSGTSLVWIAPEGNSGSASTFACDVRRSCEHIQSLAPAGAAAAIDRRFLLGASHSGF